MASTHACLIALALTASLGHASSVDYKAAVTANPIRKVVNMLQAMQTKITAEGKTEKEFSALVSEPGVSELYCSGRKMRSILFLHKQLQFACILSDKRVDFP